MKKHKLSLYAFFIPIIISTFITLLLLVFLDPLPSAKYDLIKDGENEYVAMSILDLKNCQTIPYANYTPNQYEKPGTLSGKPINLLDGKQLASRGTLKFAVVNLDPRNEDFDKDSEALAPYLEGDNYWHFTLQLPQCFSASNIYVRSVLQYQIGEIENYNFIEHSEYQGTTKTHKTQTESVFLDLNFYTKRNVIPPEAKDRAVIVTIHYEANEGLLTGFKGLPIIGKNSNVKTLLSMDQTYAILLSLISIIVAVTLAFACFIKKNLTQLPQLLITLCIGGYMISKFIAQDSTSIPYFWSVISSLCFASILVIPLASTRFKIKRFPVWIIFVIIGGIYVLFNCIYAVIGHYYLLLTIQILTIPLTCCILFVNIINLFQVKKLEEGVLYGCLPIVPLAIGFTTPSAIEIYSPVSWLLLITLGITTYSALMFFLRLERQNQYLTMNLQKEVELQTKDLNDMLKERDRLLRYLSHDMKKPMDSIRRFLTDLKNGERKAERVKKFEIIEQKIENVNLNLVELQKYAKLTYTAEESKRLNIAEILQFVYDALNPDCEANNIILSCSAQKAFTYAKKETLISVINNLLFNAIEHAECKNIELIATKQKNEVEIKIIDDGKGLKETSEVFKPYYSESGNGDNLGLGLYICKQHITSMGGDLVYTREDNKTVFTISLPLSE